MPVGGMGGLQTLRSQVTTPPTDHSGQSAARGVTTHTVTKVDLPKLKDRFSLEHHLRICENMLLEAEVGQRSGGQFQPISRLQYNVVTKILGTLELHKDIFELASDTAEQNDHKWGPVKEVLLMTHAKRESLIEEFRASTIRLKYADVDKFCADARKLYAMAIRLFGAGNTYEIRGLIETLVSKLPADRASGLISEVHRIANLGAYTPEWPLAVNFDGFDQPLLGILNRLERQEGAVRSLRSVSKSSAARMAEAEEVCDAKAVEAAKSSAPVKSQPVSGGFSHQSI
ncbi:hypothetical protein FOZ63_014566 [Perkinsus olseni]|uniref:Uncharacterized protein n=1 Tax=Perkinsus olseni TaxID=32597 RepID=A0A7J6U504_PEROL|nr:hypothetical protein FOZ63_014566 [Perkinsus olseni]